MANDKFEWTPEDSPILIQNESLKCKDCQFKQPRTDTCQKYPQCKPLGVLLGKDCSYYRKEKPNE